MNTALKLEYWWLIISGAFVVAWILSRIEKYSKRKKHMRNEPPAKSGYEPEVQFFSEGRSGKVRYYSKESSFDLYYEIGGGEVLIIIYAPKKEEWQSLTSLPPERREPVLNFIGSEAAKTQTTGGRGSYKIEKDWILIYC